MRSDVHCQCSNSLQNSYIYTPRRMTFCSINGKLKLTSVLQSCKRTVLSGIILGVIFTFGGKRKEHGQVSFWNKSEGLIFTKITILLNMHSPNLTLFHTKPSRNSLDAILFGIRNYPSLEQENAVNLPLCSCMILCWKMLWCFLKWNGIYREFSDALKLQKLIWITWQLSKMNITINKFTHCSLACLHDQILEF